MISTNTGQSIVPGTVDTGNHCDDCTTPITLPFPVYIYGTPYTSANVDSNGTIQFTTSGSTLRTSACRGRATDGRSSLTGTTCTP